MVVESKVNEVGEKSSINEFKSNLVNNVVLKPVEFDESP